MMLTTQAVTLNRLSLSESHTNLVISGQLQKTLWVTFGYSQTSRNSLILAQTCRAGSREIKHRDSPSLPVRRNPLIKLNCAETEQLPNSLILSRNAQSVCREIKGEQCSGSAEHYRYSGSAVIQHGCNNENQQVITCSQLSPLMGVKLNQQITDKEKGSTENATLWGYGFFHHELNQHLAARQDLQLVKNYLQNPHMINDNANLRNYKNQHLAEQYARTYEILVGHRVTVSKPVQLSGTSLGFLRWRRLISLCMAVTINCPVVSPSSFTNSIASTTSCGARACTFCDFALIAFVATAEVSLYWWRTVYTKNNSVKLLTCLHLSSKVDSTLTVLRYENSEAQKDGSPLWASNHNVNEAYTMALQHSTQTRPKYQYLFLAVCRSDLNATPHRESVTAHSEQDARRSLASQFVLSFAGRIPAQGVCNA